MLPHDSESARSTAACGKPKLRPASEKSPRSGWLSAAVRADAQAEDQVHDSSDKEDDGTDGLAGAEGLVARIDAHTTTLRPSARAEAFLQRSSSMMTSHV